MRWRPKACRDDSALVAACANPVPHTGAPTADGAAKNASSCALDTSNARSIRSRVAGVAAEAAADTIAIA